jgi:hypothetical protein
LILLTNSEGRPLHVAPPSTTEHDQKRKSPANTWLIENEVYPVVDAVGGTSLEAHRAALERVTQAGAKPIG